MEKNSKIPIKYFQKLPSILKTFIEVLNFCRVNFEGVTVVLANERGDNQNQNISILNAVISIPIMQIFLLL